jgi:hypothetical protein
MLGIRIMSKKKLQKIVEVSELRGGKNSLDKIQKLQAEVESLKLRNHSLAKAMDLESNFAREQQSLVNISLKNESELRLAMRELIEIYNLKLPAISISNEKLIAELKGVVKDLMDYNLNHISLLNEISETPDVKTVAKIQKYIAKFTQDGEKK